MVIAGHRSKRMPLLIIPVAGLILVYALWQHLPLPLPDFWTDGELALLRTLHWNNLGDPIPEPGNRFADSEIAARIGHQLFFDPRLSANGTISCSTCHRPDRLFTDGQTLGTGLAVGDRHTPGLIGVAFSPWHYWDGRKDSLWSQALEPLENPLEHGSNRTDLARLVSTDAGYRAAFALLPVELPSLDDLLRFPAGASPVGTREQMSLWDAMEEADRLLVNQVFSLIGKMLSAYERRLQPGRTALDDYLDSLIPGAGLFTGVGLNREQLAGLRLFISKGRCINCHNGPLLSNQDFHNTGLLPAPGLLPDSGRIVGVQSALRDEFNCLGGFSDAPPASCAELRFARISDENLGAMKTPGLRDVARTAPYMHAGQLDSLAAVIRHYDDAEEAMIGHNETEPLGLRAVERKQLEEFLRALNSHPAAVTDPAAALYWHQPPLLAP